MIIADDQPYNHGKTTVYHASTARHGFALYSQLILIRHLPHDRGRDMGK